MTSCQFYYILLSRGKLLDPAHTQEEKMSQSHKYQKAGPSLVIQWMRICLPVQGTWVRSLVQEDSTCYGAIKPVCHNYWAGTLEPALYNKRSHFSENSVQFSKEEPPLTTARESQHAATKTHCSQKYKKTQNKTQKAGSLGDIHFRSCSSHRVRTSTFLDPFFFLLSSALAAGFPWGDYLFLRGNNFDPLTAVVMSPAMGRDDLVGLRLQQG